MTQRNVYETAKGDTLDVPCTWQGFVKTQIVSKEDANGFRLDMFSFASAAISGESLGAGGGNVSEQLKAVAATFYYWQSKGYLVPALRPCLKLFCQVTKPGCQVRASSVQNVDCDQFAEHPEGFHFAGHDPTYCIPDMAPEGVPEKRQHVSPELPCTWQGFKTVDPADGYSYFSFASVLLGTPEEYIDHWRDALAANDNPLVIPRILPNLRQCLRRFCETNSPGCDGMGPKDCDEFAMTGLKPKVVAQKSGKADSMFDDWN